MTLRKPIIILVVRLIFLNILRLTNLVYVRVTGLIIIEIPINCVSFEIDLSHVFQVNGILSLFHLEFIIEF